MKNTVIHGMKVTVLGLTAVLLAGAVSAASAADGAGTFATNCAQCHGATGHADTPAGKALKAPALAGDAKVAAAGQDDVVTLIKQNPKHQAVLGKLSADDISAAAAYVKQMAGGR
jgi:mono/diheme cytochrome c family protein